MNNRMWMGPLAGALLLFGTASCGGDNKAVETTKEDNTASGDTAVVMSNTSADPEASYRMRSRRIADRVYTDLKMNDTTVRTKFASAYYNRAKRYGELRTKYQADTTGQYMAMRQAEMDTDKEMQTVLTDPQMYKEYETRRADYSDDKYADDASMSSGDNMSNGDNMSSGDATSTGSADNSTMAGGSDAEMASGKMEGEKGKVKIKGEDGSKLKMKDGDVKVKDADGKKTKMNGN